MQLAFAWEQNSHGCLPLHLIFLLDEAAPVSTSSHRPRRCPRKHHFLHRSQARVTRILSPSRRRLFTADVLRPSPDAGNGAEFDIIWTGYLHSSSRTR